MRLGELIKQEFGVEIPIQPGTGNSLEEPFLLLRTTINNYVSTEYGLIKYYNLLRNVSYEFVGQRYLVHTGRHIDVIKVKETDNETLNESIGEYFFDFTDCR